MLWILGKLLPSQFWRTLLPSFQSDRCGLTRYNGIARIPSGAKSLLIALVSASPAALLTEVGKEEAGGVLAAEVAILTIAPPPD